MAADNLKYTRLSQSVGATTLHIKKKNKLKKNLTKSKRMVDTRKKPREHCRKVKSGHGNCKGRVGYTMPARRNTGKTFVRGRKNA